MTNSSAGKMFRCTKCKSVDNYGLVFNPNYQGKGEFSTTVNKHDELVFNIDGYEFIPDLGFMNGHAVCKYCGEIKCWEYYFPRFYKENKKGKKSNS